jgi:pyrroloquinoline quinone (PQQ) biosynthesis protein C
VTTTLDSIRRPLAERLLSIMDQKHHWAYPSLTRPGLTRAQHLVHFRHEYGVYVRDFPILIARVLGQVPPHADVRTSLAENLYEEQTGGLSKTAPHPELFLRMMEGLGYARHDFEDDALDLHPAAIAYRDFLRDKSQAAPWQSAVSLLTIFVEGSVNERAELEGKYVRARGEDAVMRHPLVAHYGCPPAAMELTRAHAAVEGAHRSDAWRMVLSYVKDEGDVASSVVTTCMQALSAWMRYRDGVAERMGLSQKDRDASAA